MTDTENTIPKRRCIESNLNTDRFERIDPDGRCLNEALPDLVVCGRCAKFYTDPQSYMAYMPDSTETGLSRIEVTLSNHVLSALTEIRGDITEIKGDISGIKGDLCEVKGDLKSFKNETRETLADMQADIEKISEHVPL